MRDFIIMTDSSCDLPNAVAQSLDLLVLPLSVLLEGQSYRNYLDEREISFRRFYSELRNGKRASTSAVNVESFRELMEVELDAGRDVLYLGFSSGLSATYQSAVMAAAELREAYPEAKIETVDTLCASMGQGLLVHLAVQEKRAGKNLQEVQAFVEAKKQNIAHWVMADDLDHLKRGGRISAAAAILGTTLNIKPIIHVDENGKLVSVAKARGLKQSVQKFMSVMKETGIDMAEQTVFISHADAEEEAKSIAEQFRAAGLAKDVLISYIGPVIGAHTGPGTLAVFFVANKR